MKVRIEIDDSCAEEEIIIRCNEITEEVRSLQRLISAGASASQQLTLYKGTQEFFMPLRQILFFETSGESVYAHTGDDAFRAKRRLYELEDILPGYFTRVSKSTIINVQHIMSVSRNVTSSSLIQFHKSHKQVYVSRYYYKQLQQKRSERSSLL